MLARAEVSIGEFIALEVYLLVKKKERKDSKVKRYRVSIDHCGATFPPLYWLYHDW